MKFAIVLSVLFLTFCLIQAQNLKLTLQTIYEDDEPTMGKLALTLKGKTESKYLISEEIGFEQIQNRAFETKFSEDIESVVVEWASFSNNPLYLQHLLVIDENQEVTPFIMKKHIEHATTEEFFKEN